MPISISPPKKRLRPIEGSGGVQSISHKVRFQKSNDTYLKTTFFYSISTIRMRLRIYYHICAIGHCVAVLEEQMSAILYSGLYSSPYLEGIYCFICAHDPTSLSYVKNLMLLYGSKIRIVEVSLDPRRYERMTLERMVADVKAEETGKYPDDEDWILYIHTKGVSQTEPEKISNVIYWTRALNYHVISRWRDCVALDDMKETIKWWGENGERATSNEVVGAYYSKDPAPHFTGNFWWAQTAYVRRLPSKIGPGYLEPELNFLFQPETGGPPRHRAMTRMPPEITDLYKQPLTMDKFLWLSHSHSHYADAEAKTETASSKQD